MSFYELAPGFESMVTSDGLALLLSESGGELVTDFVASQVLCCLKGGASNGEEIIQQMKGKADPVAIFAAIRSLVSEGVITLEKCAMPKPQVAFLQNFGLSPSKAAEAMKEMTLEINGLGGSSLSPLKWLLEQSGFQLSSDPSLSIVVVDNYLSEELAKVNKTMLERKQPWLLVKSTGSHPLVGPLFIPRKGRPCWRCLSHRLLLHHPANKFFQLNEEPTMSIPSPKVGHPIVEYLTASVVGAELLTWMKDGNSRLEKAILRMDAISGMRDWHQIVHRPQCSDCGEAEMLSTPPQPIQIEKTRTVSFVGGFRTKTSEETFGRLAHYISPLTGIIPYLRPYRELPDSPFFNYTSGNNLALGSRSKFWLNRHSRSSSGGKGRTEIQAKTGAICEAIERYCMVYPGNSFTLVKRYADLADAIHPNSCMNFSPEQFANRAISNVSQSRFFNLVPAPFDMNAEYHWTPVYSLHQNKFKYLPTAFCYSQFAIGDEEEHFSYPDSNGCAAGNCLEEAILQGLLELIERDAAAIWWYNCLKRPQVNLDELEDPWINSVRRYYDRLNRAFYVLDISTDLGIPVFAAISYHKTFRNGIAYAFGAHLDPRLAVERAIAELNQILPMAHSEKPTNQISDLELRHWFTETSIDQCQYLKPLEGDPISVLDLDSFSANSGITEAIQRCLQVLADQELEVLVLDLTQPDIDLAVVRVFVPGLRHFWRRTGPGRLFDVPVKLGQLKNPLAEAELNPHSIII
jgi:oxazoline/thiazoline synthase